MPVGIVVKAYGGYGYVQEQEANRIRECALRGKLRRQGEILVGDRVRFAALASGQYVVEEVLPRRSQLIRPPIANVDQVLVVLAWKQPSPVLTLLDRILVLCSYEKLTAVLCVNKTDLLRDDEAVPDWPNVYRHAGYQVLMTSAVSGQGIDNLRRVLAGHITVLAGPSGVGKSSLLNSLIPGLGLKTGTISRKLKRGRHVTRHVELFQVSEDGWVADAPGFSSLKFPPIPSQELDAYFPEMEVRRHLCRFSGCLHYKEPDCAVKEDVSKGIIADHRYQNYLLFLDELTAVERSFKRD
ncbi:MAG: ribosome small subunit-dependent GTPase A [Peptococcaceae bacterium]|nr:ribosome small subunit-dependent GTPase A [Peptococcaceae bacterium]